MVFPTLTATFQLSLRASVAAGLAIALSPLVGLQYPIYAAITAVIVTDFNAAQTRKLGLPRLIGTALGGALGAIICLLLEPGALTVGIGVLITMFLCNCLNQQDAAKLAGYVSAIVLFDHGNHPWVYAFHRTMETFLGIGLALLVSLVPKLFPTRTAGPPGA